MVNDEDIKRIKNKKSYAKYAKSEKILARFGFRFLTEEEFLRTVWTKEEVLSLLGLKNNIIGRIKLRVFLLRDFYPGIKAPRHRIAWSLNKHGDEYIWDWRDTIQR